MALWPGKLLSGYSDLLNKEGRRNAALKLEEYSKAYSVGFDAKLKVMLREQARVTDGKVKILRNAAMLMHDENFEPYDVNLVVDLSNRILDSIREGEGSVLLPYNPVSLMKGYAKQLREMGREEAAKKMEKYAGDYFKKNINTFMQWQQ